MNVQHAVTGHKKYVLFDRNLCITFFICVGEVWFCLFVFNG